MQVKGKSRRPNGFCKWNQEFKSQNDSHQAVFISLSTSFLPTHFAFLALCVLVGFQSLRQNTKIKQL